MDFVDPQFGEFLYDPGWTVTFGNDEPDGDGYRWWWDFNDFTRCFDCGSEDRGAPTISPVADGERIRRFKSQYAL